MALCREHHTEFHTLGADGFSRKYHVRPTKLKPEDLIKLGVMTQKWMNEIDEGV